MVTVSEGSLSRGLLLCLERAKQVVEPAGTAAVAALVERPRDFVPPVVVLLSGSNIDPLLSKVLRHGLSAAGCYLAFRCRLPDRPGSLATLLGDLADLGANVLESRTSGWPRACTSTRPRWSCRSRPAARSTAERSSAHSAPRAIRWPSPE